MNVSRDVVRDLLPVYLAGDASPDTRKLVEEAIASDPEIARLAEEDDTVLPPAPALRPDAEVRAIRRTKRMVRLRGTLLGLAIFASLLPASVRGDETGVYWTIVERPDLALLYAGIAVVMWIVYAWVARKMRGSGL